MVEIIRRHRTVPCLPRENDADTGKTTAYTYDNGGNILAKTEYDLNENTVIDTISYTYDTNWKDKLTSYDGQDITYDDMGNPVNYMGAAMSWYARQMMSYSKNGTNITYKYDTNGLRTEKVVNGVKHEYYYVDGLLRSEQIGESYIMNYRYDTDGKLISVSRYDIAAETSNILYAQTNTRGDVISLYDGAGATRVVYTYDSWGKLVSVTNANGGAIAENSVGDLNSVRYRGYVYDSETGLYYLQSRYYDPETGRFLNADDVDYIGYSGEQLSYNAFAYCENEPVGCSDSNGLLFSKLKSFLSKAKQLMSMIQSIVVAEKDPRTSTKGIIRVHFNKLKVKELAKAYNDSPVIFLMELKEHALLKFENLMKRPFLFDDYCVYQEIKEHLDAYLWSNGFNDKFPTKFFLYGYLLCNVPFNDVQNFIYDATKSADIYEVDVIYNLDEAGIFGYNYNAHIRLCYKSTNSDPYYNSSTGKRGTKVRQGWQYEKLQPKK